MAQELIGFAEFDENNPIQGLAVNCRDGEWHLADGTPVDDNWRCLVLGLNTIVQRWKDRAPIDTIAMHPLPDVDALNASIPAGEWEMGQYGAPMPPYSLQFIIYLLELENALLFTFKSGTTGAKIAFEHLRDRIRWKRALSGARLSPVVAFTSAAMKIRAGGMRTRPAFEIVGWRELDPASTNATGLIEHKPTVALDTPAAAMPEDEPRALARRRK